MLRFSPELLLRVASENMSLDINLNYIHGQFTWEVSLIAGYVTLKENVPFKNDLTQEDIEEIFFQQLLAYKRLGAGK